MKTSTFSILLIGLSCVFLGKLAMATDKNSHAPTATTENGRVKPEWQAKMRAYLLANDVNEAWGLFSEAGWVDEGQLMLYGKSGQAPSFKQWVKAGSTQIDSAAALSGAAAVNFLQAVKGADKLEDYAPTILDAVRYEYVHLRKGTNNSITVVARVMMNHPLPKTAPKHFVVVRAFKPLKN